MEIKRIIAMAMMVCVGIAVWRMGAMQEANEVVIFKPSSGEPIKVPLNMVRLFETVNDAVSFGYAEELVFANSSAYVGNNIERIIGGFAMGFESAKGV